MNERLARQARNEGLLREVNERVEDVADRSGDLPTIALHCECGNDPFCGERISMTLEEYDRVRAQDDRFAVVPGHENLELERVVVRADAYVIVDKLDAYEHLVADDPRGKPSR